MIFLSTIYVRLPGNGDFKTSHARNANKYVFDFPWVSVAAVVKPCCKFPVEFPFCCSLQNDIQGRLRDEFPLGIVSSLMVCRRTCEFGIMTADSSMLLFC